MSIALLAVASAAPRAPAQSDRTPPFTVRQTVRLFNGRDLTGWTTWLQDTKRDDPRRVFTVRDGVIRVSGDGFGYLGTVDRYRDYRLVVEFRWGDRNWRARRGAARDSGIFLHAVGPDGNSFDGDGAYKAAVECQVMEGATGDFLLIKGRDRAGRPVPVGLTAVAAAARDRDGWPYWDPKGEKVTLEQTGRLNWRQKDPEWRDVFGFRGRRDPPIPGDGWNRLECVCDGRSISVYLNGLLVNQAFDVQPSSGTILLQCEGSEVFFRTVELHPLSDNTSREAGTGRGR